MRHRLHCGNYASRWRGSWRERGLGCDVSRQAERAVGVVVIAVGVGVGDLRRAQYHDQKNAQMGEE